MPLAQVRTETFTLLAVCQWFNVLNCRSATQSALSLGLLKNRWLLGGLILSVLLQLLVIYAPPMNALFHTVPLPGQCSARCAAGQPRAVGRGAAQAAARAAASEQP